MKTTANVARGPGQNVTVGPVTPMMSFCWLAAQAKAETNMNQYKKDYIDTGSPKPLYDVLIYGFILAYALAWPTEYAHYKHEQARSLRALAKAFL